MARIERPAALHRSCTTRHEGMETIGKNGKAINRELTGSGARILRWSAPEPPRSLPMSRQASGWFPAGTGPEAGKTGAKPEIWQNPQDFAGKLHSFQIAAAAFNAASDERRRGRDQGRASTTSKAPARRATTSIGRRCTTERNQRCDAAGLGPARPAGPLADRWTDRLQLVVGAPPSHRLAHLVGVRGPHPVDLPAIVGLRRQLDRALREFRSGAEGSP